MQILVAIGDAHFQLAQWEQCHEAMQHALRCGLPVDHPFGRLRLGQSLYELGNEGEAANGLVPVYLMHGREPFEDNAPKYLEFFRSQLRPPEGGGPKVGKDLARSNVLSRRKRKRLRGRSRTLLTGTELVIARVGHWNPGDVAYIRRVEFENVHLEGYDLVLLLLLQPRSFHPIGWPNPQGGYWEVEIVFHQVRELVLTVCGPHDIQTPGFALDDIRDRQWEGIHLLVGDDEGLTREGIRFGARSAQIRRCEPATEPPNAPRIWRTYPGEYRPTD